MKRAFDVGFAVSGALLASPLLLLIAICIRLDSRGPTIFRQERVGRGGVSFEILKFRTMEAAMSGVPVGPAVTSASDRRITRVGSVLRSTKLDELPQLFNVIRGDMSVVGPRPEVPKYVEYWPAECRDSILSVRPGITDPASLVFRRESELLAEQEDPEDFYLQVVLPQKARLCADYARARTFRGDLVIIAKTIRAVVSS